MKRIFIVVSLAFSCFIPLGCKNNPTQNNNNPPHAPVLVLPADGSTNQALSVTLTWSCTDPDNDVLSYTVYFGKTNPPQAAVSSNQNANSFMKTGLDTNSTYYWKIVAKDPRGDSSAGAVWSFTTKQNSPPASPLAVLPKDSSTNQSTSVTLTWSCTDPDSDALAYDVYFGKINPPSTPVSSSQSGTSLAQTGLDTFTTYFWKIVAKDPHGASTSGSVWSFTTKPSNCPIQGMVHITGGNFQMGNTLFPYDQPVHAVTVSAFYIDASEVTQADYLALMSVNPSSFKDSLQPVELVTWYDAALYCNARSKHDNLDTVYSFSATLGNPGNGDSGLTNLAANYTKNGYRLPTEAEWEYACGGGTTSNYYWGGNYPPKTSADTAAIDNNSVWTHNSPEYAPARVGTKLPNPFGLYDMIGNVGEWCTDGFTGYTGTSQTDPIGPVPTGGFGIWRGGSYFDSDDYLLSSRRHLLFPAGRGNNVGIRCVRQ
jgi:formylglycine-generating enzyme required for sulfatase activity